MTQSKKLSSIDSFFVAYQETSGILMQLGAALEIRGDLSEELLQQMLDQLVTRWPALGQKLQKNLFGLSWSGPVNTELMLHRGETRDLLHQWRNQPINPFIEPSLQLLWIAAKTGQHHHILAFRAHHALVDGLGLLYLCHRAMFFLTALKTQVTLTTTQPITQTTLAEKLNLRQALRRGNFKKMWRYTRWLASEAKKGRCTAIAKHKTEPGPIALCQHLLTEQQVKKLHHFAANHHLSTLWLGVAAWMKAIYLWNQKQLGSCPSLISMEIPVSLRGKFSDLTCIGNFIAPLLVMGDATESLVPLARQLKKQFLKGIRESSHLAVPFFTAAGKYLPWPLFRRLAASPTSTGFATSHFTWFDQTQDPAQEILLCSHGSLDIQAQHLHGPVCLHMGAVLFVWALPQQIQLSITHRLNALDAAQARQLMDLLVETLLPTSHHGK